MKRKLTIVAMGAGAVAGASAAGFLLNAILCGQ